MGLTHADVREILRIIDESELAELRVETEGFSLHVRKGGAPAAEAPPTVEPRAPVEPPADGLVTIESPMLGTFYRAEAPGAAPFVDVGTDVEPDTTVCIIEVMKMMNSVPAGVSGTIVEIAARNGELVEYGAPLFRVRAR
jgi:acetyl-CoA carboxylase biotin carboxyl carrier protein